MKTDLRRTRFFQIFILILLISAAASSAVAQEKLVLIGGGKRPPASIEKFVEWAGGEKARILIVTWASGVPLESFEGIKKDFAVHRISAFENAPLAPLDAPERAQFLTQLQTATGIFFTGGDQNRIMDVLRDAELLRLLREKYAAGAVFGGTSAGTALMSSPMMTGEADLQVIDGVKVGTREGLGLLPDSILDQHFIKRQRENRLFGLILKNPMLLGVGVDEDTVLLVKDNRLSFFNPVLVIRTNSIALNCTFSALFSGYRTASGAVNSTKSSSLLSAGFTAPLV